MAAFGNQAISAPIFVGTLYSPRMPLANISLLGYDMGYFNAQEMTRDKRVEDRMRASVAILPHNCTLLVLIN